MHHLEILAGIAFNPGIRGILVVAVGVAVLMGSVYLLLATNIGSRLGLLVALTGLFGWMVILTLIWWITPPAIGPRGTNGSWKPVEIYENSGGVPKTVQVGGLMDPSDLPSADRILADNPELAAEYPNGFVLSDLKASHPEVVAEYIQKENMNGWSLVASSAAGESQAAADVALVNAGLFSGPTAYKKLNTWEYGGKPKREDECADTDMVCRAIYRVKIAATFKHPTHYAVVQVQKVVTQEAKPGEPPPLPKVDTSAPVYSVVLVRDLGNVRLIPFLYFLISLSLFIIFAWTLHNREKVLMRNKALADAAKGA
ncbi:MAG: hypothetical protein KGR18_05665 [Acidobacteria bacterium]|nr:hypothetical protein [Acidobacteriota bacterium]